MSDIILYDNKMFRNKCINNITNDKQSDVDQFSKIQRQ